MPDRHPRSGAAAARQLLQQTQSHSVVRLAAAALVFLAAVAVLGSELGAHLAAVEAWIEQLGPWSVVAFVGLFVVAASLLVPDTILCVAAGALFGLVWGMAAATAGVLLASVLQYGLARRLLRARVQRLVTARPALLLLQRAVMGDELRLQLLLRLTPLNPATVSYLLGAAGVRFRGFLVACFAILPHLLFGVYLGHAGRHVGELTSDAGHATVLHDLTLAGGLAAGLVAMILLSRAARKAIARAVDDARVMGPGDAD